MRIAAAIARSKPGPALRRSAGARFAVIRCSGNSKPELTIAARTRSRDSRTAASGSPTSEKAGRPRWMSISTSTGRASTPWSASVRVRASMATTLGHRRARVAPRMCRFRAAAVPIRTARRRRNRHGFGPRIVTSDVRHAYRSAHRLRPCERERARDRDDQGAAADSAGSARTSPAATSRRAGSRSSPATAGPASGRSTSIALDRDTLVFVEVKTMRAGARTGPERPVLAVGPRKQMQIRRLARSWLAENRPAATRLAAVRRRRRQPRRPTAGRRRSNTSPDAF